MLVDSGVSGESGEWGGLCVWRVVSGEGVREKRSVRGVETGMVEEEKRKKTFKYKSGNFECNIF